MQDVENKPVADDLAGKGQALLATYDFMKHLSGLALVAVGGMLGLAQAVGAKPNLGLLLPVGMMSLVGFLSLVFMAIAAGTQIMGRVEKMSRAFSFAMLLLNVMLFSAAVSAFVKAFVHNLRG